MLDLNSYVRKKSAGDKACLADSISFITGIPREGVPNFTQHEDFWAAVDAYLYAWDLKFVEYDPMLHSDVPFILHTGFNERGIKHVVVHDRSGLVYDSFPKGGDLLSVDDKWVIVPTHHSYSLGELESGC